MVVAGEHISRIAHDVAARATRICMEFHVTIQRCDNAVAKQRQSEGKGERGTPGCCSGIPSGYTRREAITGVHSESHNDEQPDSDPLSTRREPQRGWNQLGRRLIAGMAIRRNFAHSLRHGFPSRHAARPGARGEGEKGARTVRR